MALANLSPDRSRQLAAGLAVAALLAVILVIAIPVWLAHRHYDDALADNAGKFERYSRIAATRPEVAKQLEVMRALDTRRFFLRSGAPALSAAEAQEAMRSIIESNGGRLVTMQAPTSREEGRYRQVSMNVQLQANIFALRKILHAIETGVPYLFIDMLSLRTQVPANHRPAPGAEPEMYVQLDVSGYALAAP